MKISFSIETLDRNRLDPSVQSLLDAACQALDQAYAPYSGFRVAASLRLSDGRILTGTNQENASYPVGICAERVAISAVNSIAPGAIVESMAIAYRPSVGKGDSPLAPCGMCRQALVEQHSRQNQPIELIMAGESGPIWRLADSSVLLPLAFTPKSLE